MANRQIFTLFLISLFFSALCQNKIIERDVRECFRESVDLDYIFFKKDKKGKYLNSEVWEAKKHPDSIVTVHSNLFGQDVLIGLENCVKLRNLSLAYSKLDSFPKQIFALPNLKVISFPGYRWHDADFDTPVTIPEGFVNLQNLKILVLDCNNIEKLSDDIGTMKNLEILTVRNNILQTLPNSFSKLSKLKHLDISVNRMDKIPECLFTMTNLKVLYLYGNQFKPEDINKLRKALPKTNIKSEPS